MGSNKITKMVNDISLISRIIVFKDLKAFDLLVKKYQSPVRLFFLHLTMGNKFLSDDLAQETFIRVYLHLSGFNNISGFKAWLFRIAYNIYIDHIRNNKQTTELSENNTINIISDAKSKHIENQLDIYKALKILKEEERTCITLFYLEDISLNNISAITAIPVNTVKSHIMRGKNKMYSFLNENGYNGK